MNKIFFMIIILIALPAYGNGNIKNDSFSMAKKMLENKVYFDHRITLYCNASFDEQKNIILPEGFFTPSHKKRVRKVEWEHAVPAENFGRSFVEWRDGSPQCIDNRGKAFKGRRCAEKMSMEYRYMQADMYNLFPAIGAVNAVRSNKQYSALTGGITFGSCEAKVDGSRFEPPNRAKGQVARAAKYMASSYSQYRLSRQQQQLFDAWDILYPVDQWECIRAKRIEVLQQNENKFVKNNCQEKGLWK